MILRTTLALIWTFAIVTALAGCAQKARQPVEGEKVLTHVVADGETLEIIANDYYGDPGRADEIRGFNRMETEDLTPGTTVRVYMGAEDMEFLVRRKRARVPYNAGLDLAARGSYLDAINQFKTAVDMDPSFAEAVYNLGVAYQKLDAHGRAVEQFERAIDLRSGDPDYYYAVGNSYFHLEEYDRSVKSFERALKANPGHLKARYSLAVALEKSGKIARARREWERYLELDSESEWADRARARLAELEQ